MRIVIATKVQFLNSWVYHLSMFNILKPRWNWPMITISVIYLLDAVGESTEPVPAEPVLHLLHVFQ
jgi:hypothetical protein